MANNNNDLITFPLITKEKERELKLDIDEKLEPQPECCIYRVPKNLRKVNEEAYTPQVISIGPLHHFNEELCDMEKQKVRFVREFGDGIEEETRQKLINFIAEKEEVIRNCYAEMPKKKFGKRKFIEMILYDAVFIINYLLRWQSPELSNLRRVSTSIWTDLLLLENQLPYFVLEGLYNLIFSEHVGVHNTPFFDHAFEFVLLGMKINSDYRIHLVKDLSSKKFKHFTDMRRRAMITMVKHVPCAVKPQESSETDLPCDVNVQASCETDFPFAIDYAEASIEIDLPCAVEPQESFKIDLPCAVKLQESGVKFKHLEGSECLLDIRVDKKKLTWIPFNCPELQIPKIEIYDQTECLFRNLMALEQCHYRNETHICNYINVMDNLINTEEDVNLLVEEGIISNFVGDNATIVDMFNKLCLHIVQRNSCYDDDKEYLQKYSKNPWNRAKATLRRVYFSNPWRGTGTVAGILLLVLTLIQTICSIKSVV